VKDDKEVGLGDMGDTIPYHLLDFLVVRPLQHIKISNIQWLE
jgi:hypothetical protein